MIRLFDILFALLGLLLLSPVFLIMAIWIVFDSEGGVFFMQKRVGRSGVLFDLFKFRSMRQNAEKSGKLTIGERDPRITRSGYVIRKYKLDELPQLINVLLGDMSLVGPRPEVEKYVKLYSDQDKRVLNVRPGITDLASLEYFEENKLLAESNNPEQTYIEEIMPAKLRLNMAWIEKQTMGFYFSIIFKTLFRILK